VSLDFGQKDKRQYGDGCDLLGALFQTLRYGTRQPSHRGDEAVTSPRNRFNVPMGLAQPPSKEKDVVGETTFFDERIGPKRPDQIVLLQEVPTVSYQQMQRDVLQL
jgi:hypothetical protein